MLLSSEALDSLRSYTFYKEAFQQKEHPVYLGSRVVGTIADKLKENTKHAAEIRKQQLEQKDALEKKWCGIMEEIIEKDIDFNDESENSKQNELELIALRAESKNVGIQRIAQEIKLTNRLNPDLAPHVGQIFHPEFAHVGLFEDQYQYDYQHNLAFLLGAIEANREVILTTPISTYVNYADKYIHDKADKLKYTINELLLLSDNGYTCQINPNNAEEIYFKPPNLNKKSVAQIQEHVHNPEHFKKGYKAFRDRFSDIAEEQREKMRPICKAVKPSSRQEQSRQPREMPLPAFKNERSQNAAPWNENRKRSAEQQQDQERRKKPSVFDRLSS